MQSTFAFAGAPYLVFFLSCFSFTTNYVYPARSSRAPERNGKLPDLIIATLPGSKGPKYVILVEQSPNETET